MSSTCRSSASECQTVIIDWIDRDSNKGVKGRAAHARGWFAGRAVEGYEGGGGGDGTGRGEGGAKMGVLGSWHARADRCAAKTKCSGETTRRLLGF